MLTKKLDNYFFLDKIEGVKNGRLAAKMITRPHSYYYYYWWYKRVGL